MERIFNSRLSTSRWLEAVWEPTARLNALPGGIEMLDIVGDGEARLIVVDLESESSDTPKVRVFKGGEQVTELAMVESPCGIVGFFTENGERRSAVVAVGVGSNVLIYKNMKPHFKYSLSYLDAHPKEREIWNKAGVDTNLNIKKLCDDLELLSKELGAAFMTPRTLKLLSMDENLRFEFAEQYRTVPLTKPNCLCCITAMRKDTWNDPAASCLILGAESGDLFVLDSRSFSLIEKHQLGWPAALIACVGLWSGDGRIFVASRDTRIGFVKKGMSTITLWENLTSPAVAIATLTTEGLAVLDMDGNLFGFSSRGARLWQVELPGLALDMINIPVPQTGLSLLAISVPQSGVLIYDGQHHVDTITTVEPISAMKFGRMGQEERALALITVRGGLCVKILKRTANFSNRSDSSNTGSTSGQKVSIPKKTRIFVEQTIRERAEAKQIYNAFEKSFLQLQLVAAKKAHELLYTAQNTVSYTITMAMSVLGLGPTYVIRTVLTSMSEKNINEGLFIIFRANNVDIDRRMIDLPLLPPGLSLPVTVKATPKSPIPEKVQALLCKEGNIRPISTATVILPVAEPDIEV